jgi:tRNA(Ile)-lysidine synthase
MSFIESTREKVEKFIETNNLIKRKDKVLMGISGGSDSICLIDILHHLKDFLGIEIAIGHINHLLRGDASDEDEKFVYDLGKRYGIPTFIEKIEVRGFARDSKLNVEEAGRLLRYKTLEKIAKKEGYNKISMGHTASDQIEWFFLAILRGSGGGGLSSMKETTLLDNIKIIRPILCLFREDTQKYNDEMGIKYRVDETNYDQSFDRNYIRENIMHLIEKRFSRPGLENIVRSISLIREDDDYLIDEAMKFIENYCHHTSYGYILNQIELKKLKPPILTRVLRTCCKYLGAMYPPSMENTLRALSMIMSKKSGKVTPLIDDIVCEVSEGMVRIGMIIDNVEFSYGIYSIPKKVDIKEINKKIYLEILPVKKDNKKNFDFIMSSKNIILPIRLRNIMRGDRMNPSGMKGTKKMSDILIDMKVPVWERIMTFIIEDEKGILGVYPYRLSDRAWLRAKGEGIVIREVKCW